jgi:hypothetical protein
MTPNRGFCSSVNAQFAWINTKEKTFLLSAPRRKRNFCCRAEEGIVNIFDVSDDELQFERFRDRLDHRIICVFWSIDAVEVWNVQAGQVIHKMSLGRAENNQESIVFSMNLQLSRDGDILGRKFGNASRLPSCMTSCASVRQVTGSHYFVREWNKCIEWPEVAFLFDASFRKKWRRKRHSEERKNCGQVRKTAQRENTVSRKIEILKQYWPTHILFLSVPHSPRVPRQRRTFIFSDGSGDACQESSATASQEFFLENLKVHSNIFSVAFSTNFKVLFNKKINWTKSNKIHPFFWVFNVEQSSSVEISPHQFFMIESGE